MARTVSRSVSASTGPPGRRAAQALRRAGAPAPATPRRRRRACARPAAARLPRAIAGQRRLADPRRAAEQHQRAGHQAAARAPDRARRSRWPAAARRARARRASATGCAGPARRRACRARRSRRRRRAPPRPACSTPRSPGTARATSGPVCPQLRADVDRCRARHHSRLGYGGDGSAPVERLGHVREQVLGVLDPGAEPDEPLPHASLPQRARRSAVECTPPKLVASMTSSHASRKRSARPRSPRSKASTGPKRPSGARRPRGPGSSEARGTERRRRRRGAANSRASASALEHLALESRPAVASDRRASQVSNGPASAARPHAPPRRVSAWPDRRRPRSRSAGRHDH